MITRPNCKINLGLNVVERRSDGYHNLETVFYPVPLCDELVLEESDTDQIEVKGIPVDGDV
ncbi:MAG: 4-(cytidine 5'-diphospho)-2-C-methyl-D-erythritol kinase, partial [Bacteroidaceae bacterium]|nr:4-(cytidine 5'-diphospho)-2-C-methyl-D-erythritol kinase [Bacteroidaceae bacterium]